MVLSRRKNPRAQKAGHVLEDVAEVASKAAQVLPQDVLKREVFPRKR